jgi:hypothetical protein
MGWQDAPAVKAADEVAPAWASAPAVDAKPAKKVNKDYKEGREAPGWQQGLASVINGPLMGFGDEVLGAVGGAIDTMKPTKLSDLIVGKKTFAENYRANRDTVRGMQDQQREENPWTTGLTQMAASGPLMLLGGGGAVAPGANAVRTTGVLANTGRAAATGVGYGAVGGLGNSRAETLGGMALDTGVGATLGGVLGAGSTPVIAGMGAAGSNIHARLSEAAAARHASEKIAQAFARDGRGSVFTSGQANPVTQAAARLGKLGDEAALVDAGGKNVNQLLDTLATLPGQTKDAVVQLQRQRTAGAAGRLRDAANTATGANGQRLNTTIEALDQTRRQAAGPLYERLRQVSVTADDELGQIVQAANQLGALGEARTMATALREPFSLDPAQPGTWAMRDLDHVKRGLDAMIQKNMTPTGQTTPVGMAFTRLRDSLVAKLDGLTTNPQTGQSLYRSARDAYAGPSQLMDAAQRGRQALAQDEAGVQAMVRGMSGGELEAFRIGAFEALRGKLGTQSGQTNIINMWKEPATREKLQVIFGDERSFREFATAAAREGVLKRVQSVGTGSQTASRGAGMADLDAGAMGEMASAVGNAKAGNPLGAFGAARALWGRVATPETVRNQMGNQLLSRGPQAQQNLNSLRDLIQQINLQQATTYGNVGTGSALIGNQLVRPISY